MLGKRKIEAPEVRQPSPMDAKYDFLSSSIRGDSIFLYKNSNYRKQMPPTQLQRPGINLPTQGI